MKHAYLIMAHNDMPLLKVLISMLDDERNDIYLHLDARYRGGIPQDLKTSRAGLYIVEPRQRVYWGGLSQVSVEYALFSQAYERGGYSYYHLLSGADLPIQHQDDIHRFFSEHAGWEFVNYWSKEGDPQDSAYLDAHYKVSRYHFGMRYERAGLPRLLSIAVAKLRFMVSNALYAVLGDRPLEWKLAKGATWVSLTHEAIGYLLSQREAVLRRMRHTRCPDEIFLHSLLLSSPFAERLYRPSDGSDPSMRKIVWAHKDAASPVTYTMEHGPELLASPMLFARKFSSALDSEVIELIRSTYS